MFIKFTFRIQREQHRESKNNQNVGRIGAARTRSRGAWPDFAARRVATPGVDWLPPRVGAIPTWTSPPLASAGVKHKCASFFSSIWPNNVSRRVGGARDATRLHRYWSTYLRATRLQDVGLRHSRRDALEARFRSATLPVDGWSNFMLYARNIATEPQLDRYE